MLRESCIHNTKGAYKSKDLSLIVIIIRGDLTEFYILLQFYILLSDVITSADCYSDSKSVM